MSKATRNEAYQPIENYGIIGDLHTIALVSMMGSIDFMCFPHFDSPSLFASLLDQKKGGHFSITPSKNQFHSKQLYLPNTNVLITRFSSPEGVAELTDFMPAHKEAVGHELIRRLKTIRGRIHFQIECTPRFDYARASHQVSRTPDGILFRSNAKDQRELLLSGSTGLEFQSRNGSAYCEFTLSEGESHCLHLGAPGTIESNIGVTEHSDQEFRQTVAYWREWSAQSRYRGRWREMVNRSALLLKLLTSHPHGSLVAAPTFGLPELIGGERNWDYRYTWIRDASFTLYALIRLGYTREAESFMKWIEARCTTCHADGTLQIMYTIDGRSDLKEVELAHLEGYQRSRPVRIGNGAADQLQLDIYGELMDSVYLFNKYGQLISHDLWERLVPLVDWVCENWDTEDAGIWEIRGGRHKFLYSRLMCWVAVDRAIRLATKRSFPAPLVRWHRVRNAIYGEIFENFWSEKRKAFIQYKGSDHLDASCLLMPLVRFIAPNDPRWLSTLKAVEEDLVDDTLVFRYRNNEAAQDGLEGEEGTFSMCSFWYVECLARAGYLEKAQLCFEKMLSYANHLGLYAEELGPGGEHLGNFPQAFTHLALISAAYCLDRKLSNAPHDPNT